MAFVESNERLYSVLKRLHDSNSGVTFENKNKDFKVLIRNDPEGGLGHYMTFETLILVDPSDPILTKCLENFADASGYVDPEETEFLIDSFEFDKRVKSEEEIDEFRVFLNSLEQISICPCATRFIHDDKDMCFYCDMTATPEKLEEFECAVCMENGHAFHSVSMPCCGNKLHKMCDSLWYRKGNKTCAFCRAELPKRGDQPSVININELVSSIASEVERRIHGVSRSATETESDEEDVDE